MISGKIPDSYIRRILASSKRIIEVHGLTQPFQGPSPIANRKVSWSPQAVEDVELIRQFIERTDPDFFLQWFERLNAGLETSARHLTADAEIEGCKNVYAMNAGYQRLIVELGGSQIIVHGVV